MQSTARQTLRFRDFELDVEAYQLRRQGRPIKLERQPMELLILLIERRGRLVSRGDIAERLWGKDVFVDVETGVNIAIRKIRQALRDSAEKPAFVETVVGKGYRFVAPVEVEPAAADAGAAEPADGTSHSCRLILAGPRIEPIPDSTTLLHVAASGARRRSSVGRISQQKKRWAARKKTA